MRLLQNAIRRRARAQRAKRDYELLAVVDATRDDVQFFGASFFLQKRRKHKKETTHTLLPLLFLFHPPSAHFVFAFGVFHWYVSAHVLAHVLAHVQTGAEARRITTQRA